MQYELSEACKYESFNTLIKINEPDLLLDAFVSQLAPGHSETLQIEIYELVDFKWKRLTRLGQDMKQVDLNRLEILHQKVKPEQINSWFYESSQNGWFCAYKPGSSKHFALYISADSPEFLIDETYIQLLFSFYCHQLNSLESTYRDSLTGLYNRKAFDHRMPQLLSKQKHHFRRRHTFKPTVFVFLDIDFFKKINDEFGHVYGDEVLERVARLMTDSFREYDLLFRYGGEEFCAVLMDVETETCLTILQRLKTNIERHVFPNNNPVTITLGFTDFDFNFTTEQLTEQADQALYYGKQHGRNCIHHYQTLIADKKIE